MVKRFILRFFAGLRQILVAIDQLVYVLIAVPIFIVFGGPCPSADETISSRVGRASMDGYLWGKVLEAIIDFIFILLLEKPGHCRRNVETAFLNKAPVS